MGHVLYQPAFDGAAIGGAVFDRHGRFLSVNDRYTEITGYSRDELLTLDSQRITHPDDLPGTLQAASRLLAGELGAAVLEKRYIRKDGAVRWVRNSATLGDPDPHGRQTFLVITEDIHFYRQLRQLAAACLDEQRVGSAPLGRHLHDGAAQFLSALSMELALVRNPGPTFDPVPLVEDSIDLVAQCTREIRSLIYLLQPGTLQGQSLGPAIQAFAAGFTQRSGIPVDTRIGELPPLAPHVEPVLFRIVQEWFFQSRRVAHPGLVLSLQGRGEGAYLELIDPLDYSGDRLPTIRSRIEWIEGRTEVSSGPSGTHLSIWIPRA
jgi:PAS domain S-box-containing protein